MEHILESIDIFEFLLLTLDDLLNLLRQPLHLDLPVLCEIDLTGFLGLSFLEKELKCDTS